MKPKLIRDRIPEIAAAEGKVLSTKMAPKSKRHALLAEKLVKEGLEYRKSKDVEDHVGWVQKRFGSPEIIFSRTLEIKIFSK